MDILKKLTVIDFLLIFLLLKICLNALSGGFLKALLKLFNSWLALYISFSWYKPVSEELLKVIPKINLEWLTFIAFIGLFLIVFIPLSLLVKIVALLLKKENISFPERFFSLILGIGRFIILASTFILVIGLFPKTKHYASESLAYNYLGNTSTLLCNCWAKSYEKIKNAYLIQGK